MAKGLRNGLGLAALLLLVACGDGGGGGGPKEDGGEPSDGGGDARVDAGRDTGTELDAEPDEDTGPDEDAAPDDDAETDDAGDGGGDPGFSCSGDGTDVTASAGGEVASSDGKLRLVLAPDALASDATVHVCRVPTAQQPSAAQGDGPLSDLYFVDVGVAFEGTLIFTGVPLPAAGSHAGFEPVTLRHLAAADGPPANLSEAVLTLADSSRLSAHVAEGGYVYLRALDAPGQYSVALDKPKATYVTGEIITLGARVEAAGTPAEERSVALDAIGCDVETIEPNGVTQTNGTSADCDVLTTVVREGEDIDGTSPVLVKDKVIDVSDADAAHPPPSFFCKFPGAGKASTRVRFINGADTELSVVRELAVTCTYSGDLVSVFDAVAATRNGAAIELTTTYGANFFVNFTPDARLASYEPLGTDGNYDFDPADDSLTPNTGFVATATGNTLTITRESGAPDPDFYDFDYSSPAPPPPAPPSPTPPFYGAAGGAVAFSGLASINCPIPSAAQLGVTFGAPSDHSTTVSFTDGSIDALSIVARGNATGGVVAVQRWIDPQDLPLAAGKRTANFLTPSQVTGLPSGVSIDGYAVNLLRVTWDEQRAFWPAAGGRVVPVACGVSVGVPAAVAAP